jgi:acyl carrier protein
MELNEIISKTNAFLADEFEIGIEQITPDADLKATLDLDSLDYIDLVVAIENNLGFKVNPEDFQTITSFQDFYDYVHAKVKQNELV